MSGWIEIPFPGDGQSRPEQITLDVPEEQSEES
jgi:hypothetical protein